MLTRFRRILANPQRYITLLPKVTEQQLCYLFRGTSFFMQGQMDINPKSRWHDPYFRDLTGGFLPKNDRTAREISELEPWDTTRRDMLILLLRAVVDQRIPGELAEVGVYKGGTARLMHHYLPERELHLFDTFAGFTEQGVVEERHNTGHMVTGDEFADTGLEQVKEFVAPINENVIFHPGYFPDSIPDDLGNRVFAFVHLDADLYEPILRGLEFFYPRLSWHGMLVVHDYNAWPGARKAVDEFFSRKPEMPVPMPDKSGSALIVKYGDTARDTSPAINA